MDTPQKILPMLNFSFPKNYSTLLEDVIKKNEKIKREARFQAMRDEAADVARKDVLENPTSFNKQDIVNMIKKETGIELSADDPLWAMLIFTDCAIRLKAQELEKNHIDIYRENSSEISAFYIKEIKSGVERAFRSQFDVFENIAKNYVGLLQEGAVEQVLRISNENLQKATALLDKKSTEMKNSTDLLVINIKSIQSDLKTRQFWTNVNVLFTWLALFVVLYLIFFK